MLSVSLSTPPTQRRALLFFWAFVASLPVAYIALQLAGSLRNFVFWDEFDTALDLVLRINAGAGWDELLQRFFVVHNEHRTVTSRLMFAVSYWLTGTLNFEVLALIGDCFIVAACALLISAVKGVERRVRLGVILAYLLFQLEHYENFLWSGSSIDHFQVVMFAVGAVACLAQNSRRFVALAAVCGVLATFTLAHGCVVWPVGAVLLWQRRQWWRLGAWGMVGACVMAAFLHGFEFNAGDRVSDLTLQNIVPVGRYWLALLGSPATFGNMRFAPIAGIALLAGLAVLGARGTFARRPVALGTALFAIGSLMLVAIGRTEVSAGQISSRYMVLGALAWAMLLFMVIEEGTEPARPFRWMVRLLPALAMFNVVANAAFLRDAETFVEMRDRAVTRFEQYGHDGQDGQAQLHPNKGRADGLLDRARERGIYRYPRVSEPVVFNDPQISANVRASIDEVITNSRAITVSGWGQLDGQASKRGQVYLVLRSKNSFLVFSALTLPRPDVASALKNPRARLSGFRAVIGRDRLPAEDFEIGVLVANGDRPEFVMTINHLTLDATVTPAAQLASKP